MSLTPYRDAAVASVAQCREKFEAMAETDPLRSVAHRMNIDVCEAVLLGAADLMDQGFTAGQTGNCVNRAIGAALGSFLLTIAGGNRGTAAVCVTLAMEDIGPRTRAAIQRADHFEAVVGLATDTRGRP